VDELILLLAKIVNRAGRMEKTTASACPVCAVPLALLEEARSYLQCHEEHGSNEVKQAARRVFD
jgi:hypothetical protein